MTVKLHPAAVRFVRKMRGDVRQRVLGKIVGVKQNTVSRAQTCVTWRDIR